MNTKMSAAQHTPLTGANHVAAVDAKLVRTRRAEKAAVAMLAALRPFANAAAQFDGCPDTDWVLRLDGGKKLTVGDLRKARAAIAKASGGTA